MIGAEEHGEEKQRIFQIQMLPNMKHKNYGQLYSFLLKRNMLPLGLYRAVNTSDSFVFTNPKAQTILYQSDSIFVLARIDPAILLQDVEDSGESVLSAVIPLDYME